MSQQMPYKIRNALPSDLNFIFSTWSKSYRYNSKIGRQCRNSIFFNEYQNIIDYLLSVSEVRVASDDSGATVYGYIIIQSPNIIHWVYVKDAFCNLGIAGELVKTWWNETHPLIISHLTDDAEKILKVHPEIVYNPFLLFNKEKP